MGKKKFNFFEAFQLGMKYGSAIIDVIMEANKAMEDKVLEAHEITAIVQTALEGADIPGIRADLIEVTVDGEGGFMVHFPNEAVKDWKVEVNF